MNLVFNFAHNSSSFSILKDVAAPLFCALFGALGGAFAGAWLSAHFSDKQRKKEIAVANIFYLYYVLPIISSTINLLLNLKIQCITNESTQEDMNTLSKLMNLSNIRLQEKHPIDLSAEFETILQELPIVDYELPIDISKLSFVAGIKQDIIYELNTIIYCIKEINNIIYYLNNTVKKIEIDNRCLQSAIFYNRLYNLRDGLKRKVNFCINGLYLIYCCLSKVGNIISEEYNIDFNIPKLNFEHIPENDAPVLHNFSAKIVNWLNE